MGSMATKTRPRVPKRLRQSSKTHYPIIDNRLSIHRETGDRKDDEGEDERREEEALRATSLIIEIGHVTM